MAEAEREVLERRRKHLIIRVDRADLSKNVLRGFTAFDTFLTQHPEFREEVTFIAHLQPSRQDVPEYAEYLERIEALVAVVNHRHGTTDWMPIDLKIYENFPDAVARYKHFDLLMVNSIFDGMNLVAKEAPAVNTRDGVLMLSENTGSHQELWDYVISVNPFDIQEQADAIYRALTMAPEQKRRVVGGPEGDHLLPQPRRLGRRPARRTSRPRARGCPASSLAGGESSRRAGALAPGWRGVRIQVARASRKVAAIVVVGAARPAAAAGPAAARREPPPLARRRRPAAGRGRWRGAGGASSLDRRASAPSRRRQRPPARRRPGARAASAEGAPARAEASAGAARRAAAPTRRRSRRRPAAGSRNTPRPRRSRSRAPPPPPRPPPAPRPRLATDPGVRPALTHRYSPPPLWPHHVNTSWS